jgi:hypothetical protein
MSIQPDTNPRLYSMILIVVVSLHFMYANIQIDARAAM